MLLECGVGPALSFPMSRISLMTETLMEVRGLGNSYVTVGLDPVIHRSAAQPQLHLAAPCSK
jgi:hypothetical protein